MKALKISQRDRIETLNAAGKIEAVFYGYDCPSLSELSKVYHRVVIKSLHGKIKYDSET